ncbi:MAG: hypothetical protein ACRET5_06140 [Steroidobacteraceae bacterium]
MTYKPPTSRQLSYLRALADRTGQTFTYPRTSTDAGREIARLKAVSPSSRFERAVERFDLASENAAREANCDVAVRRAEIVGWGSHATWSGRS